MDNETKCIVTASDNNYFPGLMALLNSLEDTNPDLPVTVFDGGLTPGQLDMISGRANIIKKEPFISITGRGKFSYIGDTPLLKFEVVELEYDKILYLDADIIVMDDLTPVFDVPCGKVGVVLERNSVCNMFRRQHRDIVRNELDIDWDRAGFNAGLFMLRPGEWKGIKNRVRVLLNLFDEDVFSKSKCQQLLNIIFSGKVHRLPKRYNFSPFYDEDDVGDPAVIHFLSEIKPWMKGYPLEKYRSMFLEYSKYEVSEI